MKNVIENKTTKTFTVQLPTGKTKAYRTLKGAENCALKNAKIIAIPRIVTQNTYFWGDNGNASRREYNGQKQQGIIDDFAGQVMRLVPSVVVSGSFTQSRANTYKKMEYEIEVKGELKKTNLTGLIGHCLKWGVELVK